MAHFSLERVLSPVPTSAFPAASEIFSSMPSHLCPRFLQEVLEAKHEVNRSLKKVENVLWRIKTFLPCMAGVSHPLGQSPFQLKKYQELVPDVPIVCVSSLVTSCFRCGGTLEDKAGRSSSRLVNNLRGSDEMDRSFLIFTQAAGVLFAEFQEGFALLVDCIFWVAGNTRKRLGLFITWTSCTAAGYKRMWVFLRLGIAKLASLCFH